MNLLETLRPSEGDIDAAQLLPDPAAVAGVDRACALLGIPVAAPAVTDSAGLTAVIFQDAAESLWDVFGERIAREPAKIVRPHPIAHLHLALPTTLP